MLKRILAALLTLTPASIAAADVPTRPLGGASELRVERLLCDPFEANKSTAIEGSPLGAVLEALKAGDGKRALQILATIEPHYPAIRDVFALYRGKAAILTGHLPLALESFRTAATSSTPDIVVEARTLGLRVLVELDPKAAHGESAQLLADYPELPETIQIFHRLAERLSAEGEGVLAGEIYRKIDLVAPWTVEAVDSLRRMEELRAQGVKIKPLDEVERVDRVSRLVRLGSPHKGKQAIEELLRDLPSSPDQKRRAYLLASRVARSEGDYRAMARYDALARNEPPPPARGKDDLESLERELASLRRGVPLARLSGPALREYAAFAGRHGMHERVAAALEIALRRTLPHSIVFDIAMIASGSGQDEKLVQLLRPLAARSDTLGRGARYHLARAHERLGEIEEARAHFFAIASEAPEDYYALWSRQRLEQTHDRVVERAELASRELLMPPARVSKKDPLPYPPFAELTLRSDEESAPKITHEELADRLRGVASLHGDLFPSLVRAEALLRLGDVDMAQLEIYETYIEYRAAIGRSIRRAGLISVAEGVNRTYERPVPAVLRARRQIDPLSREIIAEVAAAIGDYGTAIGLSARYHADDRPYAYAREVEAAAKAHGVDPDLLFAVMRVESVYQRRVVSHAGAIGLMQIMPRTGRLIAQGRGLDGFTTADLLDPATNIDFAAWYLARLLERFEGHLPLAIASYNGGPHNMSAWIDQHAETMPLDAILERIPFTETHRYVRRVLGHYEHYRAKRGAPMPALGLELPNNEPRADVVRF
ncbi:MAG: lytic transglycosylase domain-containing protein [Sandaracinaceae bacterium]|nr:lytic transglycosylase domain-containing protein [Sandaracinaceae bacterium]